MAEKKFILKCRDFLMMALNEYKSECRTVVKLNRKLAEEEKYPERNPLNF